MQYLVCLFFLLFLALSSFTQEDIINNIHVGNNLCLCLKIKNEEYTNNEEYSDIEEKNNKEINNIILIHGSSSGMHTYHDNPGPSFKGLARNIREQFWQMILSSDRYDEFYHEKSKEKQSAYKQRKELFEKNKLPLISGCYFGLYEIDQNSEKKENHITQVANKEILEPFLKNFLYCQQIQPTPYMFNWGGDLNNIDRNAGAKKLIKDLIQISDKQNTAIVAYSHGGNVTLQGIADELLKNNTSKNVLNSIEYLILLGTPIGEKTKKWIETIQKHSSIKIINIYSTGDIVQIADLLFSFPRCQRSIDNKEVINIEVSYQFKNKTISPTHEQLYLYTKKKFPHSPIVIYLPFILNYIKNNLTANITQKESL
jgi:hypothetical protein